MQLYHGSNMEVQLPRLLATQRALDFGNGFYLTSDRRQAERWAVSVARRRSPGFPTVNTYTVDDAAWDALCVLTFAGPNEDWLDFVVGNRQRTLAPNAYDVVTGPVANDTTLRVISDYMDGVYPKSIAIELLKPQSLTDQYAFLTDRAMAALRFEGSEAV